MENIKKEIKMKSGGEKEFIQAVGEVIDSLEPVLRQERKYLDNNILKQMIEPERVIIFRVPWVDDRGNIHVNRGYRIQMNSAIGPYKGGLRFHPTVNLSILKFLAFEQVFKNALTGLPMGGGKGGSDFDPKGKSDMEVMRFCQAFMRELFRHIGPDTDVPAGDIGVGAREIGYLFGMYKKLRNEFSGTLTGKGINWGGSLIRPEATGYGCVYFAQEILNEEGSSISGKTCLVSGSGNVALFAVEKLLQLGGKVLTVSDSSGYIYDKDGIDKEKLEFLKELKFLKRERLSEFVNKYKNVEYIPVDPKKDYNPLWNHKADCAFPCATQNEVNEKDAENMLNNGIFLVAEGANMPTDDKAVKVFLDKKIFFAPGKASNAGGVAVSGLEMTQNSIRMSWSREEVDKNLQNIMKNIHKTVLDAANKYGTPGNYINGANIAGFIKVADAMIEQGVV